MKNNSLDFHVFNGGVSFEYEEGFFYIKSTYYADGIHNVSMVDNSIGIDLTVNQVDELIDFLNEYKEHLSQRN